MESSYLIAASQFSILDWGIVVVYLAGSLVVGIWANRYVRSMSDYIVAGRSLGTSLGIATLLGSEIGLITVMYAAQKGFQTGFASFHIGVLGGFACLFVGLSGFIVVPLRKLNVKTIPEFYGVRFGPRVRVLGGMMMATAGILNMGAFLKTGALFLAGITGLTNTTSIATIMTVLLTLVLVYTVLGGMVSVVITDYVQFVVLSFGLLLCCVLAVQAIGWPVVVDNVKSFYGDKGINPLHEDGIGISYMIWMLLSYGLVSCAVWPTAVMRACSAKDTATVKKLFSWSAIGFMTRFILPQFIGICALVYFLENPEVGSPFFERNGELTSDSDTTLSAMPVFLNQILPVGLLGLITAGMLAAFMSTNDSYLLCWAAVLAEDVVGPLFGDSISLRGKLILARVFIVLIGVFLLLFGLWYPMKQDLLDFLAVSGAIYFTGAFSVLMFGLYWKGASRTGATLALLSGFLAIFGLAPIRQALGVEEMILDYHVGLATTVLAMVAMVVGSLIFPDHRDVARNAPTIDLN